VAYVYCNGRHGEHPIAHLAAFRGILQVDGYAGYGKLVRARTDGSIQLAFCWVHARRLFYEFYTSTQSPLAADVLARIAKLYEIEAEIRGQPSDIRQVVRQRRSRPLVEDLQRWLHEHLPRLPGWSDLAKAMRYALAHWDGLILYLDDGDGHQHRRACHQASNHYEKEFDVRRLGRRSPALGHRQYLDPELQAQRRRAARLPD
jgi:hypothetical protein